jgi:nitrite reductase/ring-hydroxylating ferredoxin subunit
LGTLLIQLAKRGDIAAVCTDRLVTCGSSHHLRWYQPPQMITSSARDGKEMSTTVNRCSHLDEHNISQGMSNDITAACRWHAPLNQQLA